MDLKWCNYEAENELADFADLLHAAVQDVHILPPSSPIIPGFDYKTEYDDETPVVSIERGFAGTPCENISVRYSLKLKDGACAGCYFHFGKIHQRSGPQNVFIWFPLKDKDGKNLPQNSGNNVWSDKIKRAAQKHGTPFEYFDASYGWLWVSMREPYRADFFSASVCNTTRLDILKKFFIAVLAEAT